MEQAKVARYVVERARQLRKGATATEEMLWDCLRDRRLGRAKFRRQHPFGRYIADFYCPEARLVIELEGGVHNLAPQREYDAIRQEVITQQGVRILTFQNAEIISDRDATLSKIRAALSKAAVVISTPLSPWERGRG